MADRATPFVKYPLPKVSDEDYGQTWVSDIIRLVDERLGTLANSPDSEQAA